MKTFLSMTIVALFSTALAGCWFYSRPDSTAAGCQKTTYGVVTATSTSENCPPDASAPPSSANVPPGPPPIPRPGML
ncbi:MAG TPA: hypothetical protein VIW95_08160 [Candidatus Binatus sp.]|uniref:hypothetical protein n=1 Tax=Candidatus Binatus sp. TaxID=2811406 RepID=UPI002F415ECE